MSSAESLLSELVEIDSVSPLAETASERLTTLLAGLGVRKGVGDFWYRSPARGGTWIYSHVDTKPVGDRAKWRTDPFKLTRIEEKLFGLGVSDAKFQLVNMLSVFLDSPHGLVIDGEEEVGGVHASRFLAAQDISMLVLVDGSSAVVRRYEGTMGQADGTMKYDSGRIPIHPSREVRGDAMDWVSAITKKALQLGLHFNVTALNSPIRERSLTLEQVELRFDVRFAADQKEAVREFLDTNKATLRQYYPPLCTRGCNAADLARFSSPLGMHLDSLPRVIVLPGGRSDNNNHQPNENISVSQIDIHKNLLQELKQELAGLQHSR
jgi:acetylornithine deacetylase/succinyl-diaminopimelate desuccinylase-like protein